MFSPKNLGDTVLFYLKDWFSIMLTGLGISFAPHTWVGGTALAIAGASVAFRSDPEHDNRELWLVFLTAFLVAHMASIVSHWAWPSFPVQITMFAAGFLSRKIIRLALRVAGLMEARGDRIADRIVDRILPPDPRSPRERPPAPPSREEET